MKMRILVASLMLSGCALEPNYTATPLPPVEAGALVSGADGAAVGAEVPVTWWRLYDDPLLDELVGQALAANTDLRAATARLRQVRAVLSETRSQRLPSTTITGNAGGWRRDEIRRSMWRAPATSSNRAAPRCRALPRCARVPSTGWRCSPGGSPRRSMGG